MAITEQSAPLYENGKPIPWWETWSGKSVAVLGTVIQACKMPLSHMKISIIFGGLTIKLM
ncbi:hypothetical protein [Yersinia nurmii]|uniref:hypothetical protein n=1 Tax=Yersinia nurmii TaxID=685706 RepID=UPI00138E54CB|nr:hypothetical protein [Yersinia nurmii]